MEGDAVAVVLDEIEELRVDVDEGIERDVELPVEIVGSVTVNELESEVHDALALVKVTLAVPVAVKDAAVLELEYD